MLGFGAMVTGIPLAYVRNVGVFFFLLWSLLFFGAALLPPIMGSMIASIPQDLKATGNSIALLMNNIFGYLPAPFVYGMIAYEHG